MFNHPLPLQWGWIDSIVTKGICDIHLNVSSLETVELGLFFYIMRWKSAPILRITNKQKNQKPIVVKLKDRSRLWSNIYDRIEKLIFENWSIDDQFLIGITRKKWTRHGNFVTGWCMLNLYLWCQITAGNGRHGFDQLYYFSSLFSNLSTKRFMVLFRIFLDSKY